MEIKNILKTEDGTEGTARFDLFDKDITVMIDDTVDLDYAKKCVNHLNNLTNDIVEILCETALKYCFEFSDDIGEEVPEVKEKRDILKYIYPNYLIINEPKDESKVGYHMECNCEWEIEHGLEFTILDDKLLYLGSFNDERAWESDDYYKDISWNYVYNDSNIFDEELRSELYKLLR